MQLITKNLTGYLEDGKRYKVDFEDKYNEVYENRTVSIVLSVYDDFF